MIAGAGQALLRLLLLGATSFVALPAAAAEDGAASDKQPPGGRRLRVSAIEGSANANISAIVLREAYKRIGIELVVESYPAERAIQTSNSGAVDGELFRIASVAAEFPNLILVPVPVNSQEAMVVTKHTKFAVKGWDSLRPYKIGVRKGIRFSDVNTRGMNVEFANNNESLLKMLDQGMVDIVVLARLVALGAIADAHLPDLQILEPPIEIEPQYHLLHNKNKDLVPKIAAALKKMEEAGEIRKARVNYIKTHFGAEKAASKL